MIRPLREAVEEFIRDYIASAVMETRNISKAAKALKIHRNTIHNRLPGHITAAYLRRQQKLRLTAQRKGQL